jgi:hypothetical protein
MVDFGTGLFALGHALRLHSIVSMGRAFSLILRVESTQE